MLFISNNLLFQKAVPQSRLTFLGSMMAFILSSEISQNIDLLCILYS
jgi:hypothetical protein